MKVVVLGGSGRVGRHVVANLVERGHDVVNGAEHVFRINKLADFNAFEAARVNGIEGIVKASSVNALESRHGAWPRATKGSPTTPARP
jgi:putative NADH-flavin reductase